MKRLLNIFLCLSLSLGLTTCVLASASDAYAQENEETVEEEVTVVEEEPATEDEETTEVNEIVEFSETSTIDEETETTVEEEPDVNEPVTYDSKDIETCTVTLDNYTYKYDYHEYGIEPGVTVMDGDITLTEGQDYTVSYSNNVWANEATDEVAAPTVTVYGAGNYTGYQRVNFTIEPISIDEINLKLTQTVFEYSGKDPFGFNNFNDILVCDADGNVEGNIYDFHFYGGLWKTGETDAGTYYMAVIGGGNVEGIKRLEYTILPRDLSNLELTIYNGEYYPVLDYMYWPGVTGYDQELNLYVPIADSDYFDVTYSYDEDSGLGTVTIIGKKNYYGTATLYFEIEVYDQISNGVSATTTDDPSGSNSTSGSTTGTVATTSTSETSDAVQTGDTTSYIGYVVLLIIAGGALIGLTYNSKKRHSN